MITVEPYTDLVVNHVYPGIVKEYTLHEAPNRLRVAVENRDARQEGRLHQVELHLPVHPLDRSCRFFMASGIDATEIGAQIQIDLIVGRHIGLRYRGQGTDGTEAFDFEKVSTTPADNADVSTTTEKAIRPAKRD
jgi:hypothetical protein